MSNCHIAFLRFSKTISLSSEEKKKLKTSRDAVAKRIRKHFIEKGYKTPEFKGQGSFSMNTIIRPTAGRYDLDLGIYLPGLTGHPKDWPKTESVHKLIVKAVEGHTSIRPVSKNSCVRLIYKSPYLNMEDLSYHLDLPIYARKTIGNRSAQTVIGFKGDKQWSENASPIKFKEWFLEQCRKNPRDVTQLKRIVKYLKAWKDNQPKYPKLPDGMTLTVLAAKNFKPHKRDDIALIKTLKNYHFLLSWQFSVKKPTEPYNDLSEKMSGRQKRNFLKATKQLIEEGEKAISSKSRKQSLQVWRSLFGKRFPID